MASIRRRELPDGTARWDVRYRDGAGTERTETFAKEKQAKGRRADVERELIRTGGRWVPPSQIRFGEYADRWLDEYAATAVRPRVLENYRRSLRHARDRFASKELAAITRGDVKALLAARASAGAAANTIRNTLIPLRECLAHAVDDGLIAANPAAGVPIPRAPTRKIIPPTHDQVRALLAAAGDPDAEDVLTVAASLGLRLGELFAIRWSDVDFGARLVKVRATNWRGEIHEHTKTEAGERAVPLFESARKLLRARRLRLEPRLYQPDVTVFATVVGTPENPTNWERRVFKKALKAAGLEGAFRFHDLRHYAVSTLIAQRADIKLLQAIAGHASATVTLDTYAHLMTDRVTEAADLYDPLEARQPAIASVGRR